MNKNNYLENEVVIGFIRYLTELAQGKREFIHGYRLTVKHGPGTKKLCWSVDSFLDAKNFYIWGSKIGDIQKYDLESTERYLVELSKELRTDDERKVLNACANLMKWGNTERGNVEFLEKLSDEYEGGIVSYLKRVKKDLSKCDIDIDIFGDKLNDIRLNSGFTKIYALLLDDWVIYDGRVGAALAILALMFIEGDKSIATFPKELQFAWGAGRGDKKRRDPNINGQKTFTKISNSKPNLHALHNIRANWIIGQVAENILEKKADALGNWGVNKNEIMRGLEAALFMIGYDLTFLRMKLEKESNG